MIQPAVLHTRTPYRSGIPHSGILFSRWSAIRLALLLFVTLAAAPAMAAPQGDEETPSDAPVAQTEPAGSDTAEPADTAEAVAEEGSDWFEEIDSKFGDYVVGPAAQVLFFDFWTGPRTNPVLDENDKPVLDENEIPKTTTSPGWLKTAANPNGISIPFVVIWLLSGGVFLTLRMGFINVRGFAHAIQLTRGVYDTPGEPGEVSHFQALAAALSATVGLGNIAGVAIAIATGGPGATFWIIMIGLLGMTAKFTECTLGQLYRVSDEEGTVIGGPMRYLKFGLKDMGMGGLGSVLAVLFMILCIGASFGGGNAFQVGQSLEAIRGDVPILQTAPWAYGLIMAIAVGAVIVGGIKSIGAVAGKIVPFMCLAYVSAAIYILAKHAGDIPAAVSTICTEAFSPSAMYGGFIGVLVIGIKRAVFSNEAGVGSAAIAHAAAKTDEPVSEGIVALLEPFIDTVVVCTITALMVVVTGAYLPPKSDLSAVQFSSGSASIATDAAELDKVAALMQDNSHTNLVITPVDGTDLGKQRAEAIQQYMIDKEVAPNRFEIKSPDSSNAVADQLPVKLDVSKSDGARVTLHAFISGGHGWFKYILYLAVILFAYSTCISWSYYGERCWVQLFGESTSLIYKGLFLLFTVLGSIVTRGNILDFSDLMILGMSLPNLLGVFILSGLVKRRLDIYWKKHKDGELERADQYK